SNGSLFTTVRMAFVSSRCRRAANAIWSPWVGHTPAIGAEEWVTATGAWVSDREHGLQFKADVLTATPPTGVAGIEKYLASGQMRGIGPAMAKRIVGLFGENTF